MSSSTHEEHSAETGGVYLLSGHDRHELEPGDEPLRGLKKIPCYCKTGHSCQSENYYQD